MKPVESSSVVQLITAPTSVTPDTLGSDTTGGGMLRTLTFSIAEELTLPNRSAARANSWCGPLAKRLVSQLTVYGALVKTGPSGWLSTYNWTSLMPTLLLASTDTEADEPNAFAPASGVTATAGGRM